MEISLCDGPSLEEASLDSLLSIPFESPELPAGLVRSVM